MRTRRTYPKTSITDFRFKLYGFGTYEVTYTSPVTGKKWIRVTTDMQIIDATRNEDAPKLKDLNTLKAICKL